MIIYGPPAVGKLTVARKLAQETNYKLMHNHLTVDLVVSIFDRDSKPYTDLIREIRTMMILRAIDEQIQGLILTYVCTVSISGPK